jgi:hypothetical protein
MYALRCQKLGLNASAMIVKVVSKPGAFITRVARELDLLYLLPHSSSPPLPQLTADPFSHPFLITRFQSTYFSVFNPKPPTTNLQSSAELNDRSRCQLGRVSPRGLGSPFEPEDHSDALAGEPSTGSAPPTPRPLASQFAGCPAGQVKTPLRRTINPRS